MIIRCPGCGVRYRIEPGKTDKAVARIKCPKCSGQFEIPLPRPETEPMEPAVTTSAPPPAPAETLPRVLVVDDSPFFRELVLDVLKPLALHISVAANGVEALELIRRERPKVVLLDLNLPQMDGYELIRKIRGEKELAGVRLLAMSGVYRKEMDVAEVQRAGADDFISKSFTPDQLQERVKKLLGG